MPESDVIRPAGPGKFATMVNRYVYELAQEGLTDEILTTDGAWLGMLKATPAAPLYDPRVETSTDLNEAEQRFLAPKAGVIIEEAGNGGPITMDYFDQVDDLEAAWTALEPRADVAEEAVMDGDLPEIPESAPNAVTDAMLTQAEKEGYEDGQKGARPGQVPSMHRYDVWMSAWGYRPDRHSTELGFLTEAWRKGLYRYAAEQGTVTAP